MILQKIQAGKITLNSGECQSIHVVYIIILNFHSWALNVEHRQSFLRSTGTFFFFLASLAWRGHHREAAGKVGVRFDFRFYCFCGIKFLFKAIPTKHHHSGSWFPKLSSFCFIFFSQTSPFLMNGPFVHNKWCVFSAFVLNINDKKWRWCPVNDKYGSLWKVQLR